MLVGTALIGKDGLQFPTWGKGNTAPSETRAAEVPPGLEATRVIGAMPFLWVSRARAAHLPRRNETQDGYLRSLVISSESDRSLPCRFGSLIKIAVVQYPVWRHGCSKRTNTLEGRTFQPWTVQPSDLCCLCERPLPMGSFLFAGELPLPTSQALLLPAIENELNEWERIAKRVHGPGEFSIWKVNAKGLLPYVYISMWTSGWLTKTFLRLDTGHFGLLFA
jgi:hypothetical protein